MSHTRRYGSISAEIVGTAFVRVRALTKQLSDDIKDGVNKGIKDAKVNDEGREAGDDFADGFNESSSDGIKAGLKDTFEDDENDEVAEEGGERSGEKWSDGFRDRMRSSMSDTFRTVFRRDRDRDRDIELGGEDDGETYSDGFGRGARRRFGDGDLFEGLFSGLTRGLRRGAGLLAGIFGGGGGAEATGRREGDSFGRGFLRGLTGALTGAASIIGSLLFNPVTLIGGLVATLGPLLINSVVGIASQLGTVLNAAIGGALAIGAGLGTGLLALIPLIAAFTAETPLLELFKEEMAAIKEEFMVTAEIVQEQVLPGVILLAETIVDTLLPAIDDFALAVGDAFGDFMEQLSDLIASEEMVSSITSILEDSAEGFRGFLEAMVPFTEFVIRVFEGLAPLAATFAEDLETMFTRWRDFVRDRGAESLESTFRGFYDTFKLVLGGLADITVALYNVLSIGDSATGQGFFERFREFAREFREFTTSESGIAQIQGIFERAQPVLSEFAGLLGDIIELLFVGATSETATGGMVSALQWLRQEALPWLVDTGFPGLKTAIETAGSIIGGVVEALTPFAEAMAEAFSPVVMEVIDYLGDRGDSILGTLTETLEGLEDPMVRFGEAFASGLDSFFDVMKDIADTGVLDIVARGLVAVADGLTRIMAVPGLSEFLGTFLAITLALSAFTGIVGKVVGAFTALRGILAGGAIAGALAGLGGAISAVAAGFGILITLPAAAVGAIAVALAALAYIVVTNWSTITGFIGDRMGQLWTALQGYFGDIRGLWDSLWATMDRVGDDINGWIRDVIGWFGGMASSVGGFVGDVIGFFAGLPGRLLGLVGQIGEAAADIGRGIWNGLTNALTGAAGFATRLAGAALDAVRSLASGILNGIINAINNMLPDSVGKIEVLGQVIFPGLDLPDNPIPRLRLAMGGIFDRATPAVIGEAGREVVIPLTKPARALELAMASGLFDVLGRASRAPVITSAPREDNSGIDRLIEEIRNLGGPGGGDTIQLVLPPGAGDTPVSYALATARELRSDRWRRPK